MAVTALNAISAIPVYDDCYIAIHASGTALEINPGDYVSYSGNYAHATHNGVAWAKASGLGIAMDRNPAIDRFGNKVINSALIVATHGVFRVSAAFSGQPLLGVLALPDMTGSGVNAPTGLTGLGAVWNTGTPLPVSGGTGAAPGFNVAQVIGWYNSGPAGTGQLDIRLWPRTSDFY